VVARFSRPGRGTNEGEPPRIGFELVKGVLLAEVVTAGRPPTTAAIAPAGVRLSHAEVDAGHRGEIVAGAHGS
jgi:hypothetical protein